MTKKNKQQKQRKQTQIKELERVLRKGDLKKQEYIRVQAVLLNLKRYEHKEIAKITLKSIDAIEKWITLFNKYSVDGLKDKPTDKARNYTLSREQKEKIKTLVLQNKPNQLNFQGEFWSPNLLKQLVQKEFNVSYKSKKAYIDLLKYCGFTFQKVQYKDERENKEYKEHEKLRLEKKLKKGVLRMYW